MRADGTFCLDLWNFYESWDYLPDDGESRIRNEGILSASSTNEICSDETTGVGGVPLERANHPREIEESRVRFTGSYLVRKVPALKLRSFCHQELNQDFAPDPCQLVTGKPSWWSADGRCFLYFAEKHGDWRANAVRTAGGDGLKAVLPGGRKAGRGYAYSHESTDPHLCDSNGFFGPCRQWSEIVEGDVVDVPAEAVHTEGWAFEFYADEIVLEERHMRGRDEGVVDRQASGPVAFRGWRHGSLGSEMRLVLPPIPQRHKEGDLETYLSVDVDDPKFQVGITIYGDPDVLILRPSARL
jgi:hypothetical protein